MAPKAIGPFTIVEKRAESCYGLAIPVHIRGRAYPVFHSSDLFPYETRVLDPLGMLLDGWEGGPEEGPDSGDGSSGEAGPEDDCRGGPILVEVVTKGHTQPHPRNALGGASPE